MRLISALHRWTGGILGLLLALIALSGTILLWEGEWVSLPGAHDPLVENVAAIGAITERAASAGGLQRITYAGDETALHLLVYRDGSGAYVRRDGTVVDRFADQWGRPELWIFDLHHRLFAGEAGETIAGIAGIAGLLFVITGVLLWLRSRSRFAPTLVPTAMKPGPIVKHHRDLGILAAPLLFLSLTTGVLMDFPKAADAILSPLGAGPPHTRQVDGRNPEGPVLASALEQSKQMFPNALLRRITLPSKPGAPLTVRMRQPFEWTPNGRTQLSFDAATGRLLSVSDPAAGTAAAALIEKFYPVHTAKVGGIAMKLLMSLSGLSLAMLGSFAVYAFWFRKAKRWRRRSPVLLSS
ncbi:MAG: PepSY-associated TM helix domain-containing protein [Sphingomicrobium sp.]